MEPKYLDEEVMYTPYTPIIIRRSVMGSLENDKNNEAKKPNKKHVRIS